MVIGGIAMVIVIPGVVASVCFIACGVRKSRWYPISKNGHNCHKDITMKPNSAYMTYGDIEQLDHTRVCTARPQLEPIYEQIE